MGGSHNKVMRLILGGEKWLQEDGIWEYPQLEEAIWAVGLEEMKIYISRIHNTPT